MLRSSWKVLWSSAATLTLRYSVALHGVGEEAAPRRRGVASKHANVALDVDNCTDVVFERKKKYRGTAIYYLYCDLLVVSAAFLKF